MTLILLQKEVLIKNMQNTKLYRIAYCYKRCFCRITSNPTNKKQLNKKIQNNILYIGLNCPLLTSDFTIKGKTIKIKIENTIKITLLIY